ncbi:spore cortex biosynthesis protein YabQ [Ornithinibacillus sp. BX22]|uniref:Spore cortex biosynthesis protein YabQ n=2 Tax=Ornithinibacillus TaxID=484508 RepID=A0A923L8D7_9BACI|nr:MULTISPECIES: spore cortex biosynthesis protein YabQ [Ornithinibacillus]MBC5638416.1 spore cortex biosynthesis protein YabQ [Ornithinibacillus hominis]MBS3678610.1 spore cortex biosynthesis protein YabQ [Ornithinibacillus massiliensis]
MTLSVQFLTMVSMIGGGFYLGMALDTFRRFHKHWKQNVFLVYVMEVSFWLTQMFILYFILFQVNAGELRLYVFAACFLGFAAYQVFAAKLYKRVLESLIILVNKIYQVVRSLVNGLLITPIKYIVKIIIASVLFLFNMIMLVFGFIMKCLFIPIKWVLMKIYQLLPKKFKLFLHHLAGFYSKIQNICRKGLRYITSKRR